MRVLSILFAYICTNENNDIVIIRTRMLRYPGPVTRFTQPGVSLGTGALCMRSNQSDQSSEPSRASVSPVTSRCIFDPGDGERLRGFLSGGWILAIFSVSAAGRFFADRFFPLTSATLSTETSPLIPSSIWIVTLGFDGTPRGTDSTTFGVLAGCLGGFDLLPSASNSFLMSGPRCFAQSAEDTSEAYLYRIND